MSDCHSETVRRPAPARRGRVRNLLSLARRKAGTLFIPVLSRPQPPLHIPPKIILSRLHPLQAIPRKSRRASGPTGRDVGRILVRPDALFVRRPRIYILRGCPTVRAARRVEIPNLRLHHTLGLTNRRSLPQQPPSLPILLILLLTTDSAQRNRLQPAYLLRRDDVPNIFRDHIRRQIIERSFLIWLMTTARRTDIPLATLQPRNRALHLHRHKLSRTPHHTIKTPRVSPGLASRQPLLASPRQKHRLRPLPALFLVFDNLRVPPLRTHSSLALFISVHSSARRLLQRRHPECPHFHQRTQGSRSGPTPYLAGCTIPVAFCATAACPDQSRRVGCLCQIFSASASSRTPALFTSGRRDLARTYSTVNGCPISRAVCAREVGIFANAALSLN